MTVAKCSLRGVSGVIRLYGDETLGFSGDGQFLVFIEDFGVG